MSMAVPAYPCAPSCVIPDSGNGYKKMFLERPAANVLTFRKQSTHELPRAWQRYSDRRGLRLLLRNLQLVDHSHNSRDASCDLFGRGPDLGRWHSAFERDQPAIGD